MDNVVALPEAQLLAAARRGDAAAFGPLVAGYRGELYAHCYRMLGSTHDAEDALQDALLGAWKGLAGFEGRSSLRAWLFRVTTNAYLRLIARRPRRMLSADTARRSGTPTISASRWPGRSGSSRGWTTSLPVSRAVTRPRATCGGKACRWPSSRRSSTCPAASGGADPARGARLLGRRSTPSWTPSARTAGASWAIASLNDETESKERHPRAR